MPGEDLEKAWLAHAATVPIEPCLKFNSQGLVLGAGTVLSANDPMGHGSHVHHESSELRLLALISSAYGRSVTSQAMAHIRRATRAWNKGESGLAAIHLALTRLEPLARPREDARRMFMADILMEAGAEPEMILSALGLPGPSCDQTRKLYNPAQPRVPAGNGRMSGQWERIGLFLLRQVSRIALRQLASIAARFTAPTVFLGVLFVPTNKTSPEGEYPVPGHPGLRVGHLVGETLWRVIYTDDDGEEQTIPLRPDGTLRDPKGRIVGRVLPDGHLALDLASVAPNHLDEREPRYCPAPILDNYGQGPVSIARAYEDQVKRLVNPEIPTPTGMAVALVNPMNAGAIVKFDDCQHSTGTMVEAKGPTFTTLLQRAVKSNFADSVDGKLINQARSQIQAAGPRRVVWFFADKEAADHARELFTKKRGGLERIEIEVLPYLGRRK